MSRPKMFIHINVLIVWPCVGRKIITPLLPPETENWTNYLLKKRGAAAVVCVLGFRGEKRLEMEKMERTRTTWMNGI